MSFQGHIENGLVVLDEPVSLPNGTVVRIEPVESSGGRMERVLDAELVNVHVRFQELARLWRKETSQLSVASRMAAHPAYRQIVAMGDAVVPFLLAELRRRPDHWFIALEEITGQSPVPPESEGKVKKMADAWIQWGIQ